MHMNLKNGGTMVSNYGQYVARGRADSREAPAHITHPPLKQSYLPKGLILTWVVTPQVSHTFSSICRHALSSFQPLLSQLPCDPRQYG